MDSKRLRKATGYYTQLARYGIQEHDREAASKEDINHIEVCIACCCFYCSYFIAHWLAYSYMVVINIIQIRDHTTKHNYIIAIDDTLIYVDIASYR